jgi:hypothetical protein
MELGIGKEERAGMVEELKYLYCCEGRRDGKGE